MNMANSISASMHSVIGPFAWWRNWNRRILLMRVRRRHSVRKSTPLSASIRAFLQTTQKVHTWHFILPWLRSISALLNRKMCRDSLLRWNRKVWRVVFTEHNIFLMRVSNTERHSMRSILCAPMETAHGSIWWNRVQLSRWKHGVMPLNQIRTGITLGGLLQRMWSHAVFAGYAPLRLAFPSSS